jgi:hypothetical protein
VCGARCAIVISIHASFTSPESSKDGARVCS